MKKQPYSKDVSESTNVQKQNLKKQDVIFDDIVEISDSYCMGHIELKPQFITVAVLKRYEEKITTILGDAGYATESICWDINFNNQNVDFTAYTKII